MFNSDGVLSIPELSHFSGNRSRKKHKNVGVSCLNSSTDEWSLGLREKKSVLNVRGPTRRRNPLLTCVLCDARQLPSFLHGILFREIGDGSSLENLARGQKNHRSQQREQNVQEYDEAVDEDALLVEHESGVGQNADLNGTYLHSRCSGCHEGGDVIGRMRHK